MCFFKKIEEFFVSIKDLVFLFIPKNLRIIPNIFRFRYGICLEKYGVKFKINKVTNGLYKKPFTIEFGEILKDYSNGDVDIDAVNSYVMGNFYKNCDYVKELSNIANIYDPSSKYKDVWIGVYFVFDDTRRKGRKFILKDSYGSPRDKDNFNTESLFKLIAMDQKLITWSSHQNERGYTRKVHDENFYFDPAGDFSEAIITGPDGREWKKNSGSFKTWSILPDTKITNMELLSSNRCVFGLPYDVVYDYVKPWHEITFHGSVISNYFESEEIQFWAVAYYGASEFETVDGKHINHWADTDIKDKLEYIYNNMTIGTLKPHRRIEKYAARKKARVFIRNEIKDKYR